MRITRKILEARLQAIRDLLDMPHLRLDHNAIYGGYMIVDVDPVTGGHRQFGSLCYRMSASSLYEYMRGIFDYEYMNRRLV